MIVNKEKRDAMAGVASSCSNLPGCDASLRLCGVAFSYGEVGR